MKLVRKLFPGFAHKQDEIEATKRRFHRDIDKDISRQRRVNAKLRNGLAFKVFEIGSDHGHH